MTDPNHSITIIDEVWQEALDAAGETQRPDQKEDDTLRSKVLARSYSLGTAAKRLNIQRSTVEQAVQADMLPSFTDPEGVIRIPGHVIEDVATDTERAEEIYAYERVTPQEIASALGETYSKASRRLQKARLHRHRPRWGEVRSQWGLPDSLMSFRQLLYEKDQAVKESRRNERQQKRDEERDRKRQQREQREQLRNRLVETFPEWRHENRIKQQIVLHVGPPNSGKTHQALESLVEAGSGWYLAPLRLLAFEIFDRLNANGIFCNLLTGEEYINIPGAQITAATIEMFNPNESGQCVVIDEAQMLADADRGWAWTRAMMNSQAPIMHIIAPETARELISQMAITGDIPLRIQAHERLTDIRVAHGYWTLDQLPAQTILVAFSRRMVLHLKTDLERMKRKVSVVYGNLPPEVRRKQADRFANGETEICIATDAVGMGLNLPADNVCFYEVEKFDGRDLRTLTASEVHQIGGRAGRYGLSKGGTIGATSKQNLRVIKRLFESEPETLNFARIAPTVEELAMIPGSLADQLIEWSQLQSIPDRLRSLIKTADMTERIELARMLTDKQVAQLGLEAATTLVNAPTRRSSRPYWRECTQAILNNEPMPAPPRPPQAIMSGADLETIELCVTCADIYLWLAHRPEFAPFAPDEPEVRLNREYLSTRIDHALLLKLDTARRCTQCRKPLSPRYRYQLCNTCHSERYH